MMTRISRNLRIGSPSGRVIPENSRFIRKVSFDAVDSSGEAAIRFLFPAVEGSSRNVRGCFVHGMATGSPLLGKDKKKISKNQILLRMKNSFRCTVEGVSMKK